MIAEISISRIRLVWKWKECHARMAIPNASEHATAGAWGHFRTGTCAARAAAARRVRPDTAGLFVNYLEYIVTNGQFLVFGYHSRPV